MLSIEYKLQLLDHFSPPLCAVPQRIKTEMMLTQFICLVLNGFSQAVSHSLKTSSCCIPSQRACGLLRRESRKCSGFQGLEWELHVLHSKTHKKHHTLQDPP